MPACLTSVFAVSSSPVSFQIFFSPLPFPSLSHPFPLYLCLISVQQFIWCSPFLFCLRSSLNPSPITPPWVSFSLLPAHPLPTHTSERDTAWVHQGRTELVPNWQGIACFMYVIENANAQEQWLFSRFFCWRIYEEHQTPLWSFRSRPFSTGITWVDKGIPKANHSSSSLLRTLLFSRRWKFNRNAILQAFQQRWSKQLHADGRTLCTPKVEQHSFYVLFSSYACLI